MVLKHGRSEKRMKICFMFSIEIVYRLLWDPLTDIFQTVGWTKNVVKFAFYGYNERKVEVARARSADER